MIQGSYEKVLKVLSSVSGLTISELEQKVEEKRSKLAGLISKEGAAQIIAAELGVSFDDEKLKIEDLEPGMKKVNLIGKVIEISPVRTFMRNDKEGKVVNLVVADETSNVKIVLWDANHIGLVERGEVVKEKVIEILNGNMRDNEVHLGSFSELKLSKEILEDVKTEKIVKEKKIVDFRITDNVNSRAFIVQTFEPKFFYVCPECKKKAIVEGEGHSCVEHGKVAAEKRALINLVLDDGTETIRAVLFHEQLPLLGLTELEDTEALINQRQALLGKELIFSGNVRNNQFFNNPEFVVNGIDKIILENVIEGLQK